MAVNADEVRNIVGIIGNVICFGVFISPMPTFFKICKTKEVGDYSPIPYLATLFNCMMWVVYGLPSVTPDSLLVITVNVCGLAFEGFYLVIFLVYATPAGKRKVLLFLAAEILFLAAVLAGVLLGVHTHKKRSLIVGVLCVIFGICMYASPLAAMREVIRTKSVEYMPLPLSLASFFNGIAWTTYALLPFDIFIMIPNGLGTLLAAGQLVIYCCYCGNTSKEKPCRSEVQLSAIEEGNGNRTTSPAA